ncbi:hypothetical protein KSS87_004915 [Heliosperma pusillum]|nr:hypothetical protein KSS87_010605 [Heliosperma pusillum]KAH9616689.1 hypothetical protein KSS87_016801 [Heliosperma pusillum]KAH9620709.1 hypothetical protein KSS87_004915 [Heliosperma pusillum]
MGDAVADQGEKQAEAICYKDNHGRKYILMEKLHAIKKDAELKGKALMINNVVNFKYYSVV